jgi:RNA polymerase sigma-70 factor, ECF subfamily
VAPAELTRLKEIRASRVGQVVDVGDRHLSREIEAVYRRRYGKFLRVAVAILRDEQLAEEAVHDAFVRALRHRRGFDDRGALDAWLWRIVVNEARRRRSIERAERRTPPSHVVSAAATTNGHREHGAVEAIVATLPERQRLALFLRYYADLDYDAIATALGVKPGTVAATLHAAHAALRRQLLEVER